MTMRAIHRSGLFEGDRFEASTLNQLQQVAAEGELDHGAEVARIDVREPGLAEVFRHVTGEDLTP